jgi:hypothetical protein
MVAVVAIVPGESPPCNYCNHCNYCLEKSIEILTTNQKYPVV